MAPSYWRLDASSLLQPDPYDNIFGPYTRTFDEELALGPLDGVDEVDRTSKRSTVVEDALTMAPRPLRPKPSLPDATPCPPPRRRHHHQTADATLLLLPLAARPKPAHMTSAACRTVALAENMAVREGVAARALSAICVK